MRLALPRAARVSLTLLDPAGRIVRTMLSEELSRSVHPIRISLASEAGRALSAGLFFLRLETGPFARTARVAIVR